MLFLADPTVSVASANGVSARYDKSVSEVWEEETVSKAGQGFKAAGQGNKNGTRIPA